MRIIKQCWCCGKEFIATKITSLYCSNACNHKVQHQKGSVKSVLQEKLVGNKKIKIRILTLPNSYGFLKLQTFRRFLK